MGKKFVFNPETLSFEIAKLSFKNVLKTAIPHFFVTIILGGILGYTLYNNTLTPELRILKQQNEQYISDFQTLSQQVTRQEQRMSKLENNDDKIYRSVLGLKPIPQNTRLLGYGGTDKFSNYKYFEQSDLVKDVAQKSFHIQSRIKLEANSYDEIIHLVKDRDKFYSSIPSICPISKKDINRIGSGFGYRMHPILHVIKMHTGVDISAANGTPVYAAGDGIITQADATNGGYGTCIRINHGYNYITVYAHLSKLLVAPGQKVKRGQLIGLVGSTGRSTSPHLHYEVRINNEPVNPKNFLTDGLSEKEYDAMINESSTSVSTDVM